jgi:DeoR/GlpR family transcriptional regulator of sugar metabolism
LNRWPIRKPSVNVSDANEFKIELVRKLLEAAGTEGEITDLTITFTIQPRFNFRNYSVLNICKTTQIHEVINEQNMNTREQEKRLIELRRAKVLELAAKGFSNTEIAEIVKSSEPTVSRDLAFLRRQAKENIHNYIDEELPGEFHKTLVGLNSILKEAWATSLRATGKDKLSSLVLAKECYSMK